MVGVYFSIRDGKALLEGYVRLYACLEVLKIITLSVEFYLSLSYDGENAIGRAAVTVTIRVLAFSKSVTLEVTRRISTKESSPLFRTFSDSVSPEQWVEYCDAFA